MGGTGVELWWYPKKEFVALLEEQQDELRDFTYSVAGKKQKDASAWSKTQGEGHPNKKQKTNNNTNSGSMSQRQVTKVAAAVVKIGKKEAKEISKFDKGMEK